MVRVRKRGSLTGPLQVPLRSPQGAAGYQVWERAFSKQRSCGALGLGGAATSRQWNKYVGKS